MAYRINEIAVLDQFNEAFKGLSGDEKVDEASPAVTALVAERERLEKLGSEVPPVHAELHYNELVTVEIPYSVLIGIVSSAQRAANAAFDDAENASIVAQITNTPLTEEDTRQQVTDTLSALVSLHVAAEFNAVRLAARPLDLPSAEGFHNHE